MPTGHSCGFWGSNSSPLPCAASTLTAEPSPQFNKLEFICSSFVSNDFLQYAWWQFFYSLWGIFPDHVAHVKLDYLGFLLCFVCHTGWPDTMQHKLSFNLQQSCLSLPSPGITGVYHHTWLEFSICWETNLFPRELVCKYFLPFFMLSSYCFLYIKGFLTASVNFCFVIHVFQIQIFVQTCVLLHFPLYFILGVSQTWILYS